ncbi:MAG TPA: hypothetical protein PKN21_06825 [Bacteroidales bacterium]|nr:hypothetical protein [Bacteroidales bacterium]
MKKIILLMGILLGILVFNPSHVSAQQVLDSARLVKVNMNDGAEFIGNIISENDTSMQFLTGKYGQLTILKKDITKVTEIARSSVVKGKIWGENPQSARYLFMPNGYGLKKGEGYYQNIWVLFNQVSVGVTDYFSVGAGTIPTFLFGSGLMPVWVVPKFSIPVVKDKFNVGIGAFTGTVIGESNSGFGILYGLATVGDRNSNLTFGLGYGYAAGSFAKSPMISLAGMVRVSPRGYLLTENYYIKVDTESLTLISMGGRSILGKAGLDYGLVLPLSGEMDSFFAIPWLGLTLPFGKNYHQTTGAPVKK